MKYAFAMLLPLAIFSRTMFAQHTYNSATSPGEEYLQALIEETLSNNPDIASEYHKISAARQRIPQAASLADPELNFKLMEIPGREFNKAMYANVELMQTVPFPTKLAARRSLAELLSMHAEHDHMEKVVEVVADLKSTLAMLWFARESAAINKANRALLQKVLKSAETLYAVGKASQQEILKTNIELSKIDAAEARIQEQILSADSRLHAILNRPASVPIGSFNLPDILVSLPPVDRLLSFARENRPLLRHDSLNVVEKDMMVRLMKQEYLPDLKFSIEYVRMPVLMENRWSIVAGISLPFAPWTLSKASSRVQEAEAERSMLSSAYVASKNMIESQIRSKLASVEALAKQLQYELHSILPQLSHSIELLLTEYQTGKTTYLMLLDGYKMYNEMLLDIAMTKMNYQEALASLEREVGVTDIHLADSNTMENHQ